MRNAWCLVLLGLWGCGEASLTLGTGPVSGGGGGGPLVQAAEGCAWNFADETPAAIAEVSDRGARDVLMLNLRDIEKVANAGSWSMRENAIQGFLIHVDQFEQQARLSPDLAARLRALGNCYLESP